VSSSSSMGAISIRSRCPDDTNPPARSSLDEIWLVHS